MNYRALALDMAAYASLEDLDDHLDLVRFSAVGYPNEREAHDLNDLDAEIEQLAAYVTHCRIDRMVIGR
jgi:hypothetical protein